MNIVRMKKAITVLEEALKDERAKKFNMDHWGETKTKTPVAKCVTTACAFGTIALSKTFKELEVTFDPIYQQIADGDRGYRNGKILRYDIDIREKVTGNRNFYAAEHFFDLSDNSTEWLFMPSYYEKTTGVMALREVIRRMKNLVKYEEMLEEADKLETKAEAIRAKAEDVDCVL